MSICDSYNPDDVFKRFKVVEFPISFVGLSTTLELDVEVDLDTSAYLKTLCEGRLMKFDDAYEISAAHRAFNIKYKNSHTIEITFIPKNECITKAKYDKQFDNRFVFDLRLIKVDGSRCCYDELHSEIGRYYISGQFEYPNIHHIPENVNFGDVIINTKTTKYIRIQNESMLSAKMQYVRIPGINLDTETFTISPNTSKKIAITIKSTCLKLKNNITFKIINPHDVFKELPDKNCITYTVNFNIKVIYKKTLKQIQIESLHKLKDLNPTYTYTGKELLMHNERNKLALNYLKMSKLLYEKIPVLEKYTTDRDKCYTIPSKGIKENNFCQTTQETPSTYDLFQIRLIPFTINFGRVGASTYGEHNLIIDNNTKFNISVEFFKDKYILYSDEKKVTLKMEVKSFVKANVTIFCLAHMEGTFLRSFKYTINEKYHRDHPYTLQISNPTLMVNEKSLKFGMVTTETFVVSVPIRIYNNYNIPVDFKWDELQPDTPFEIIPNAGTIPRHSCRLCDVQYICKPNKTKTHEVELLSISKITRTIPFELSVVTRKLSIKFLQTAVTFRDIALNLETVENVKLENSSREIALFHVVEPLIQGLKIEPMCGTIRPKIVMVFDIVVKIPCILEFNFDIYIKINNKENVILPVSGNVVEPKLIIHPKNIYMPRIPCNMITFVPITFQNLSALRTVVEVLDTGDDNIFDVYIMQGNERKRIFIFNLDGGQSKTVYIKVYDIFRREYEMYIPFRINGLLGPPNQNLCSTELRHYIEDFEKNVLPSVEPGYLMKLLPENAPDEPEDWKTVLKDFYEKVLPGVTHWNSPHFHAYYPTGCSYASIIGNLLSDGLGVIGLTWMASPACTELEVVTMNWLGKLLGLPEEFLNCTDGPGGGVIQGSASEATLVALLAAKDKMVRTLTQTNPDLDVDILKTKFVAYTSNQCNSSVEKAGVLGSMKMRLLKSDPNGKLRGETLKRAFEEDKAEGLIPCYVVANLGTTGICAFDPLYELGPICNEENVWLHVDAAYAASAFVCPEYRHLMKGVEYANSFVVNAHKWLLVNFDCSAMWVKDCYDLIYAFDVQRMYLDDLKTTAKIPDYRHWQMPLGRRFRSLKLWTVLKMYGADGIRDHIRNQISLAQHFAKLVRSDNRFIVEPEPSMGLVCFRLQDGDNNTKMLLQNLTEKKELFMVACTYRNRYVIRFVVCSRLTTKEHIETSWNLIKTETDRLISPDKINAKSQSISTIDHLESINISEKSK